MVTQVAGVAEEQEMLPVSSLTHLTQSLLLHIIEVIMNQPLLDHISVTRLTQ